MAPGFITWSSVVNTSRFTSSDSNTASITRSALGQWLVVEVGRSEREAAIALALVELPLLHLPS